MFICYLVFFFFFKQKTAYEMRISDWSSDVCSSDLFARLGRLYCQCCGQRVQRDSAQSIQQQLAVRSQPDDPRLVITFPVVIPANYTEDEVRGFLDQQGYTRIHHEETRLHTPPATKSKGKTKRAAQAEKLRVLHVVQDRFRFGTAEPQRVMRSEEHTSELQ